MSLAEEGVTANPSVESSGWKDNMRLQRAPAYVQQREGGNYKFHVWERNAIIGKEMLHWLDECDKQESRERRDANAEKIGPKIGKCVELNNLHACCMSLHFTTYLFFKAL